jgi:prostaglandin-H2 D-isomerase / glutathione transferase
MMSDDGSLCKLSPETNAYMGEINGNSAFVLYYLPLRARAESIRMILHFGGVSYQDVTIHMGQWQGFKSSGTLAPFGQLPSIRLPGGEIIAQSGAIARYAAKLAKIYPSDPLAAARADMIFEYAQDLNMINPLLNFWPTETETWNNNYKAFFDTLPKHLDTLSAMLGNRPFFGGTSPTHGDFAIFHVLDACSTMKPACIESHSTLVQFMNTVSSLPAIRAYLDNRPPANDVGLCGSYIQREIAKVYKR